MCTAHQVSEVLDGEADALLRRRVQGFLQEPSNGAQFQNLGNA